MSDNEQMPPELREYGEYGPSLLELMKLPFEERNRLAIAALKRSQDEDCELLDAFDDDNFDD